MNDTDVFAELASLAPTTATLDAEWDAPRRRNALQAIIGPDPIVESDDTVHDIDRPRPERRRPRRRNTGLVASGAAIAASAAVLLGVLLSGGFDDGSADQLAPAAAGPVFDPPPGLSDVALPAGHYSYRVDRQLDLDAAGKPIPNSQDAMLDRNWVAANGDIVSVRTGSQHGCFRFPLTGGASLEAPTQEFLRSLPTKVDALNAYLRKNVQGSSSHDEAVFVAVGDMLRTADGLASPRLRAALVAVLSRTPGVWVHRNARDYLGRASVRADFVDQQIRPGEVQSLYFDASTFQFTEERYSSNSQPGVYSGPSPAYDKAASADADDPAKLSGAGYVGVMITEKVVASLPKNLHGCPTSR